MIGFFDSGLGGITVLRHAARALPTYDYLYLADSARVPYGNRPQEDIFAMTVEAMEWLFAQGCGLIIVACNTVSSESLRKIQQEWLPKHYPNRRVLGVLIPVAEEAARVSTKGQIGVVGTRATIAAQSYEREIKKLRPEVTIHAQACPLLVPLIEEGWEKKPETKRIVRAYLRPLKKFPLDTLVLGCTHYAVLIKEFQAKIGKRVRVLDPGSITAASLSAYLTRHPDIDAQCTKGGAVRFATTGDVARFNELGSRYFGASVKAERVTF